MRRFRNQLLSDQFSTMTNQIETYDQYLISIIITVTIATTPCSTIVRQKLLYTQSHTFIQKSKGDLQFCVDYQKLNALTKKDWYPLLLIDETLVQMSDYKFITKFNIIAAFNKLHMDPGSKDLMTFITSMRSYKYCILPSGLTNRPVSYQHYMNNIFLPYLNDFVQVYLDDIIIYSKT